MQYLAASILLSKRSENLCCVTFRKDTYLDNWTKIDHNLIDDAITCDTGEPWKSLFIG